MRQFNQMGKDELIVVKQVADELVNLGDRLLDMLLMLDDNEKDKVAGKNINTAIEDFKDAIDSGKEQLDNLLM